MSELIILTREQFYEQGEKLFGENRRDWVFCCEWCNFKQSFNSIRKQIDDKGFIKSMRYGIITDKNIKELQPKPDQECLSENCNYVSYGLIGSGLEIDGNRYLMLANMKNTKSNFGRERREKMIQLSFVNSNKTVIDALPKTHALGRLIETRLHEKYPDLDVELESQEGYKLNFNMSFNNRPTSESDVRSRFFDWLKDYPSIKIQELNLTLKEKCLGDKS